MNFLIPNLFRARVMSKCVRKPFHFFPLSWLLTSALFSPSFRNRNGYNQILRHELEINTQICLVSIDLMIYCAQRHFEQYFSYIMTTSFSSGRSRSTHREPLTMGKQLVNCITCGCESSAPFFVIYKAGREPTAY